MDHAENNSIFTQIILMQQQKETEQAVPFFYIHHHFGDGFLYVEEAYINQIDDKQHKREVHPDQFNNFIKVAKNEDLTHFQCKDVDFSLAQTHKVIDALGSAPLLTIVDFQRPYSPSHEIVDVFLENILRFPSLKILNFYRMNLNDSMMDKILQILCHNIINLEKLDFECCDLGFSSLHAIIGAMKYNKTVISLNLSDNGFIKDVDVLRGMLRNNKTLRSLRLSETVFLTPIHWRWFFSEVTNNQTLQKLFLHKSIEAMDYPFINNDIFYPVLANNQTLTVLHLGDCALEAIHCEYLAKGLAQNRTLLDLTLNKNNIGDRGMAAIAAALKVNNTLQFIDVANNNCSMVGISRLVEALKVNTGLIGIYPISLNEHSLCDETVELMKTITWMKQQDYMLYCIHGFNRNNAILDINNTYHNNYSSKPITPELLDEPNPLIIIQNMTEQDVDGFLFEQLPQRTPECMILQIINCGLTDRGKTPKPKTESEKQVGAFNWLNNWYIPDVNA